MKKTSFRITKIGGVVAAVASPAAAFAAVPSYVSTALTSAQTTLTEYIEAAAPMLFATTIIIAAIFLVVRMIKRAAS